MSDLAVWARAIGQTIRRLRTSQGLTQSELAGEHFSKSYISQLERGSVTPSLRALDILAERLGVPTTFFIEATGQYASFLLKAATVAFFTGQTDQATALAEQVGKRLGHLRMRERIEYQLLLVRLAGKSENWPDVHVTCRGLEELLLQSPYRSPGITVPFNYWWGKAWLAEGNRRQAVRRWEMGLNQLSDQTAPPPEEGLHLMVELAELYRQLGDPHSSDHVTARIRQTLDHLSDLEGLSRWFLARSVAAKTFREMADAEAPANPRVSGDQTTPRQLNDDSVDSKLPDPFEPASPARLPAMPAFHQDAPSPHDAPVPKLPADGSSSAAGEDVISEAETARDAEAWARAHATLRAAELIRRRLSENDPARS